MNDKLYLRRIARYAHNHSFNDTLKYFHIKEPTYWKALDNTNRKRLDINLPVVIGITK